MADPAKKVILGALVVGGAYAASLALWLVWVMIGLAAAGRSLGSRASNSMLAVLAATALTFLATSGVVFWGLGWAGAGRGWRIGLTLGYAAAGLATLLLLAFLTAVLFNR